MYELVGVQFHALPADEEEPDEPPAYLDGLLPLPGLTVTLGRNSAGKTTLLEALEQALLGDRFGDRQSGRRAPRPQLTQDVRLRLGIPDAGIVDRFTHACGDGGASAALLRDLLGSQEAGGLEVALVETDAYLRVWAVEPVGGGLAGDGTTSGQPTAYVAPFEVRVPIASLVDLLPRPVVIPSEVDDLDLAATDAVRLIRSSRRGASTHLDYWSRTTMSSPQQASEAIALPQEFADLLAQLGTAVTDLLPDFLADLSIEVLVSDFELLFDGAGLIQVRIRTSDGALLHHQELGTGTRRWVGAAFTLAAQRLSVSQGTLRQEPDEDVTREAGPTGNGAKVPLLLLVDEPELHLHPTATRSVGRWLAARSADADIAAAITASHAPELLRVPSQNVATVLLKREPHLTRLLDLGPDLLAALEHHSGDTGFELVTWLYAANAVLLVEGEHDRIIVQRFFEEELRFHRVVILPLRGHKNATRVPQTEFIGHAGLPLFVLLDNVQADIVARAGSPGELDEENRTAYDVLQLKLGGMDIAVLPYDEPDIICAIPPETIVRRYPNLKRETEELMSSSTYWEPWITEWRAELTRDNRRSFKHWVAQRLGITDGSQLVPDLVERTITGDQPSPALRRAMKTMLAQLSDSPR